MRRSSRRKASEAREQLRAEMEQALQGHSNGPSDNPTQQQPPAPRSRRDEPASPAATLQTVAPSALTDRRDNDEDDGAEPQQAQRPRRRLRDRLTAAIRQRGELTPTAGGLAALAATLPGDGTGASSADDDPGTDSDDHQRTDSEPEQDGTWDDRVDLSGGLDSWQPRKRHGNAALAAAGIIATVACSWTAIAVGAPALGHGFNPAILAASLIGLLCGVALIRHTAAKLTRRSGLHAAIAVAALATGSFTVGIHDSVVIDGRIYLSSSKTAQVWELAETIREQRAWFAEMDELLALDIAQAQARSNEYGQAINRTRTISDQWAAKQIEDLPAGEFAPVSNAMAAAAYNASEALETKRNLLAASDARLLAELKLQRASFLTAALNVDTEMTALSAIWSFPWGLDASTGE